MTAEFLDLVDRHARRRPVPLAPALEALEAFELVGLWQALEASRGGPCDPPYWAWSWPGSQALARFVLDRPETVAGSRVLDLGSGNGLAAIASARAGAAEAIANDIDPWSGAAVALHADWNGVDVRFDGRDLLDLDAGELEFDVLLVGDLFYSERLAARARAFVERSADLGRRVWIGEPGRSYALRDRLEPAATYRVPASLELENRDSVDVRVLRVTASR